MEILKLILKNHIRQFCLMLLLTVASGGLGIGVLAFINHYLLHEAARNSRVIWLFIALMLVYFFLSILAQIALANIGQRFIFNLRVQMMKRILDAPQEIIQRIGKAKILASLSTDIRSISIAFTMLPNVVQGLLFFVGCCIYLLYLSPLLFSVTAIWLIIMGIGSYPAMRLTHRNFKAMRKTNNALYDYYENTLDGHKELTLNRARAKRYYDDDFTLTANKNRRYHVLADTFSAVNSNWNNVMMLGAVGCIFYLCAYLHWASIADAATFAMAILFMRSPLMQAIGSFPMIMQSQVGLKALQALELPRYQERFMSTAQLPDDWHSIRLENLTYNYPEQGGQIFSLAPINLTLKRGETVFLIGANGSGKSTLCMLLAGLYRPAAGKIYVDDIEITDANIAAYRHLFASVFTDFHLFAQMVNDAGENPDSSLIATWLKKLQLSDKAIINHGKIENKNLSQGQKKRLGLLAAIVEQRQILLLDEWAADQDPHFRRQFYEELLPALKASGRTIFAISHDDKYFHHADRILEMDSGHLSEHTAAKARDIVEHY